MSESDRQEPQMERAPPKAVSVRRGGENGDVFVTADSGPQAERQVILLNEQDAREMYRQLGEVVDQ